jgi:hypothetical protein
MEPETPSQPVTRGLFRLSYAIRVIFALIGMLAVSVYILCIVLGKLQERQKLSASDVGMIVVAVFVAGVLLRPEFLNRLTHLKVGNVELELEKLQQDQQLQRHELDDVRFVLTLLLRQSEVQHLKNLKNNETQGYEGNKNVCNELRNLRTLGLIQSRKDRTIGELEDRLKFDLNDFVQLTARGRHYLERLGEYKEGRENKEN